MKPTALTYASLIERCNFLVETQQLNPRTAANRASTLRAFLRANRLNAEDVVGAEMRGQWPDALKTYLDELADKGTTQRNITNARAALTPMQLMVVEHDRALAIAESKETPFQQLLKSLIGKFAVTRVAKQAHVPYDMLLGWTLGKVPRASSARYLARLENFFAVEPGQLAKLAGVSHTPKLYPQKKPGEAIAYREKLSEKTKESYYLKVPEDSPLRKQWRDFMKYKTDPVPVLERSSKGAWRIAPLPMGKPLPSTWYRYLDGKEVPSAAASWTKVGAFLGWLCLPVERGGKGIPESACHTLAWLVFPDLVQEHLDWRAQRAGCINSSHLEALGWIQSLVRADVGYFPQSPWLLQTLPEDRRTGAWSDMCARHFKHLGKLTQSFRGKVEVSRDPFEPIEHIVELDEPMEAYADMLQRLRQDRPVANPLAEAIWSRDIVLLKLLATNPLRMRQFCHLTWRPDNSGNLYQKADGSWWIFWKGRYFKNARGAAGDQDYDSPVHETAWADIERYLSKDRPLLMHTPTDLVFLTRPTSRKGELLPHQPWADLSRRVQWLTSRYLWGCPGIGTHAVRHLTGTAIMKASPGDIYTAARVLNDRPATVEKHYARITAGDGTRRMGELLGKSLKRM